MFFNVFVFKNFAYGTFCPREASTFGAHMSAISMPTHTTAATPESISDFV